MRRLKLIGGALGFAALAALSSSGFAQDAVIAEWVESDAFNETYKLSLGYPVPIPVDTPLPFDGFRTYNGLHMRHQDLAATTTWAHGEIIGETRQGRSIWAYRLGDEDRLTPWGLPESATLTNGGIHAREWQTPEAVTGILELLSTAESDTYLMDYLREQVNMVVIPVLNIDGFMQTQREPRLNYMLTDPDNPNFWPRDGRMRRKNMLKVDEDFSTQSDHLNGVDLNRNNLPYWNTTNGERSSSNEQSLVHHGQAPQSEPETRALDAAAALGPRDQLRVYTDVHSYSMVHFWTRTDNDRLAIQTERVLQTFTDHHRAFPAGKWYAYADRNSISRNSGIGTTDEYFTVNYEVPSWTLEIEPSNGQSFHQPLPGGGSDYGGDGENGHDGFILPEREIRRVREQLAESFTTVYYRQSGPPHIQSVKIFDQDTGALIVEADWDFADETTRNYHLQQLQPLVLGEDYDLWIGFSKPMRWLIDGQVAAFPGQGDDTVTVRVTSRSDSRNVDLSNGTGTVPQDPGGAPLGYLRYRTDAQYQTLRIRDTGNNRTLLAPDGELDLEIFTRDMTGLGVDSDPSTVANWSEGSWVAYENSLGQETDFGGTDSNLKLQVSTQVQEAPFVVEPGIAAAWFDPDREGEGFLLEVLADNRAVMYWFTYDDDGTQDWYIALGAVEGNRLVFPELIRTSGGIFGSGFDPDLIEREVVGSAAFLWTGCDSGTMDWHVGNERGRQTLNRITRISGVTCGPILGAQAPVSEDALYSGSWFNPERSGEGYVLQMLGIDSALVYWFSFDTQGHRRWFFGTGTREGARWVFPEMNTTAGPGFGAAFAPEDFELQPWGSLELELNCAGGEARYASTEADFGEGLIEITQLTRMDGLSCVTAQ